MVQHVACALRACGRLPEFDARFVPRPAPLAHSGNGPEHDAISRHKEFSECHRSTVSNLLEGHVVLVTTSLDDLEHFIAPLRMDSRPAPSHLQRLRKHFADDVLLRGRDGTTPIAVLVDGDVTEEDWERISRYDGLHIVEGSGLLYENLLRAGVQHASCLVVLSNVTKQDKDGYFAGDAETVLIVRNAMLRYKAVRTVAEINFNGYIRHVTDGRDQELLPHQAADIEYNAALPFVGGSVVGAAFLESLLCQAFFNPFIIAVIHAIILRDSDQEDVIVVDEELLQSDSDSDMEDPQTARGHGGDVRHTETLPAGSIIRRSLVQQLPVPNSLFGQSYRRLFDVFTRELDIVPLGLYRALPGADESGVNDTANQRYVVTNPPPDLMVQPTDMVYCLLAQGATMTPLNAHM
jgi:hypothetical protein